MRSIILFAAQLRELAGPTLTRIVLTKAGGIHASENLRSQPPHSHPRNLSSLRPCRGTFFSCNSASSSL